MEAVETSLENPSPTAEGELDLGDVLFQLHTKILEIEAVERQIREQRELWDSLKQREAELHKTLRQATDLQKALYHKDEENISNIKKTETEMGKAALIEEALKKKTDENAALRERRAKLLASVQKLSVYKNYFQRVCRITRFNNPDTLADHVESVLHVKQQLVRRETEAQASADLEKKAMAEVEDRHNLFVLESHNELSRLQSEYDNARSEALSWEKKWNHIQETAAKKTLELGQIKMSVLNLYEMSGGTLGGDDGVDMNDTERQLDQIKMFFADNLDILRQYERKLGHERKSEKGHKVKNKMK